MKAMEKVRWLLLAATVTTLALGSGCSDSDDANPSPGSNVIGGSKGDGGSSGNKAGNGNKAGSDGEGGNDPGSAGSGSGNTGNEGGGGPTPGGGGEGGNPIPTCDLPETGEDGCFNCPTTDREYLNRCTTGDCVPFDNSRLTKLNPDGSLPDLN
jgi:hypothetical protein